MIRNLVALVVCETVARRLSHVGTEGLDASYQSSPGIDAHVDYVWGSRYIDDIVAHRFDDDPAAQDGYEDVWFHLTDAQFSTVAIIDESANVEERVTFSAYGRARHHWFKDVDGDGDHDTADRSLVRSLSGSSIGDAGYRPEADLDRDGDVDNADYTIVGVSGGTGGQFGSPALPEGQLSSNGVGNQIGFHGYVFNAEIGTFVVRWRTFDPVLGRWLERDPIGYVDGSNLYEFTLSSPLVYVDSKGLSPESPNGNPDQCDCEPITVNLVATGPPGCPPADRVDIRHRKSLRDPGVDGYPVTGLNTIISQAKQAIEDCKAANGSSCCCIKRLNFHGHGGPGWQNVGYSCGPVPAPGGFPQLQHYTKNGKLIDNMTVLSGLKGLMCPDSEIYFYGCSVGGNPGFLQRAADLTGSACSGYTGKGYAEGKPEITRPTGEKVTRSPSKPAGDCCTTSGGVIVKKKAECCKK